MEYLTVKNWAKFQHYKDRSPPWIKLATDTFQNYEFSCLQDASKLLAICSWTLAARCSKGQIPADFEWIKKQCGLGDFVRVEHLKELIEQGFIIDASNVLASCKQSACLETEGEGETERESNRGRSARPTKFTPPDVSEVTAYCRQRKNHVDAERFVDFYASKDWMVGKSKMKDWKASVRTWEKSTPKGDDLTAGGI